MGTHLKDIHIQRNLIFDIGLHKGEDTDYYLKKGFQVVAIEANPELAHECRLRFSREITNQNLQIIEGAVAEGQGKVSFWLNERSIWGTTHVDWAKRNEKLGAQSRLVEVNIIDIKSVFQQFGIPYYLKLDIEGGEDLILNSLLELQKAPPLLSMESEKVSFKKLRWELGTLIKLGYERFKIIQQASIPGSSLQTADVNGHAFIYIFPNDSSGPFGEELPGRWLTYREACIKYLWIFVLYKLFGDGGLISNIKGGKRILQMWTNMTGRHIPGWYDTHATTKPPA